MELTNTFTVPAPVEEAWARLLDIPAIAPCLPGAALTGVDGDTFTGTVKVKLGPISLTYKGSGRIAERDDGAHRAVVKASGRETRGPGTATATITATLIPDDGGTRVDVATDLAITGRPAQFGRSVLADVSTRLLDQFAACLTDRMRPAAPPPGTPAAVGTAPESATTAPDAAPEATPVPETTAPIDLFAITGAREAVRRAIPYVVAFAAGALAAVAVTRLRHHTTS